MKDHILIIGANGGLARATIKHLIKNGFTEITMACRSEAKGKLAKKKILEELGRNTSANLKVVGGFDMNDPNKIEDAVKNLVGDKKFGKVFLAAGGVFFSDQFQTIDWRGQNIERNVFQNMMGSHVSLSLLKKHDLLNKGARIVMSGGEGARDIPGMIEAPKFSTAEELRQYVLGQSNIKYNPMNALGASKFLGALWTRKISQLQSDNMEVVWFSPGFTYGTDALEKVSFVKRWIMMNIVFNIFKLRGQAQSPDKGGRKFADCIMGKIGKNGELIGAPQGKAIGQLTDQIPMNPNFSNEAMIEEFWKILEECFGAFGV